jgi:Terpene cyclase DEP1
MTSRESALLVLAIVGFVVPNVFVGSFIADEGVDVGDYLSLATASTPSTQLLSDLVIAGLAFFIWAAIEGHRVGMRRWWVCIPASLLVGLCFGLPLFLFMRERAIRSAREPATPRPAS